MYKVNDCPANQLYLLFMQICVFSLNVDRLVDIRGEWGEL